MTKRVRSLGDIKRTLDPVQETAQALKQRGYHVHPLCLPDCEGYGEKGCGSPGKVPHIKGWQSIEADDSRIKLTKFRNQNIGVRVDSPLLVIDCDVDKSKPCGKECAPDCDKDGIEQLERMYAEHGIDMPEPTLRTGSGGVHYWLRIPDGTPELFCNRKLATHIDTRTDGLDPRGNVAKKGQSAIPPSLHKNGRRYEWLHGMSPPVDELPLAPAFVLQALLWEPPPALQRDPSEMEWERAQSGKFEVGPDGFDPVTRTYWDYSLRELGGGGADTGRNKSVYLLGLLAAKLTNCALHHREAHRSVPSRAAFLYDAEEAARAAGLPDGDLERQFDNGWDDAGGEMNCPPEMYIQPDLRGSRRAQELASKASRARVRTTQAPEKQDAGNGRNEAWQRNQKRRKTGQPGTRSKGSGSESSAAPKQSTQRATPDSTPEPSSGKISTRKRSTGTSTKRPKSSRRSGTRKSSSKAVSWASTRPTPATTDEAKTTGDSPLSYPAQDSPSSTRSASTERETSSRKRSGSTQTDAASSSKASSPTTSSETQPTTAPRQPDAPSTDSGPSSFPAPETTTTTPTTQAASRMASWKSGNSGTRNQARGSTTSTGTRSRPQILATAKRKKKQPRAKRPTLPAEPKCTFCPAGFEHYQPCATPQESAERVKRAEYALGLRKHAEPEPCAHCGETHGWMGQILCDQWRGSGETPEQRRKRERARQEKIARVYEPAD